MSTSTSPLNPILATLLRPIIDEVIGIEGDFVDDPNDAGGATRWGVTEMVARADGYQGHMRDFPREWAVKIYQQNYFIDPQFHRVAGLAQGVAKELFEIEVNCPPGRAATFLQRALKGLNDPKGTSAPGDLLYPDPIVDGHIGQATLDALSAYLKYRKTMGETVLLRLINAQQAVYYIERAEKRVQNERFLFGWVANRVVI